MKKYICLLFAIIFLVSATSCSDGIDYNAPIVTNEGEAITPNKSSKQSGKNYKEVVTIFEGRGFKNIQVEPVKGKSAKNYKVAEVSVGGNTKYSKGETVASDISVIIRYYVDGHSAAELSEGKAITPKKIVSGNYQDAMKIFESRGFTNVNAEIYTGISSYESYQVEKISVGGNTNYSEGQIIASDTPVIVFYLMNGREAVEMPEGKALLPNRMSGENYQDVIKIFESRGFKNIRTEKIPDLITGWLTSDGEVKEVSVGGNTDYVINQTVSADIEVVIRYHTFPDGSSSSSSGKQNNETTASAQTNKMPNVVGMTAGEAQETLKNANIKITKWAYQQSVITNEKGSENANNSFGSSISSAPSQSNMKIWKVISQSVPEGQSAKDGVVLTMDLKVINTTNNAEFYKILNEDNSGSESFVNSHNGELVEFTGVFMTITQDSSGSDYYTYLIGGFDNTQSTVMEFFCFKNTNYHAVSLSASDYRTKIYVKSVCHIVAKIEGFDSKYGILLTPVGVDYIKTLS